MVDGCVQVVTTAPTEDVALELARGVVERRLGACVQVTGPIRSVYRWDGAIQVEQEWQCQVKTTAEHLHALVRYLREHHPYDVPEIVATRIVGGSEEYLSWVREETAPADRSQA